MTSCGVWQDRRNAQGQRRRGGGQGGGGDRDRHCADDCRSKICRAKFGTYTGTGLSGPNHPNSVEYGFCPAVLVLFRADGGQKTTVIRGVTACSSGIGSMNNYYTWGDSGVSWVSQTLDSDSGGYMASSQFNSSGKEYCYLVLGYDADWIKQKTAPSLSARG